MPIPSEFQIQRAFTMWLKGVPGKIMPAIRPGLVAWHTPNGGSRSAVEGMHMKESGVEPGIPDYFFLRAGVLYFIEFKKPNGRPAETQLSTAQNNILPRLRAEGAIGCTIDNLEDAKAAVRSWGLTLC